MSDSAQGTTSGRVGIYRQPDIFGDEIVFISGERLWIVPKAGGLATPIPMPEPEDKSGPELTFEISFPRFSPDGRFLAFSANFEGSKDIWVYDRQSLSDKIRDRYCRLTCHPLEDRMAGWYPEHGNSHYRILFASNRESAFPDQYKQLYSVPFYFCETEGMAGGPVEKLNLPYGEFGSISPNGKKLAFQFVETDQQLWNRYRGGLAPDIFIYDLESEKLAKRQIPGRDSSESHPLWLDNEKIVFLSDWYRRDQKKPYTNLWICDANDNASKQLTTFTDYGMRFPSLFRKRPTKESKFQADVVFEHYGRIYLFPLEEGNNSEYKFANDGELKYEPLAIKLPENAFDLSCQARDLTLQNPSVGSFKSDNSAFPKTSIFFEGRGRLWKFSPTKECNLNWQHNEVSRYPSISPAGRFISHSIAQKSGYSVCIHEFRNDSKVTLELPDEYYYSASWSADESYLSFIDSRHQIWMADREKSEPSVIDVAPGMSHPELERFSPTWHGHFMVYSRAVANRNDALFLFDTESKKVFQLTSGDYNDRIPCFHSQASCLYFASRRDFPILIGEVGYGWIHASTQKILAIPIESISSAIQHHRNDRPAGNKIIPVYEDLERSAKTTLVEQGRFLKLAPGFHGDGLLVHRNFRQGELADGYNKPLDYYSEPLSSSRSKRLLPSMDRLFAASGSNPQILVEHQGSFFLLGSPSSSPQDLIRVPAETPKVQVDPAREWQQLFDEAWRLANCFFYFDEKESDNWKTAWEKTKDEIMRKAPISRVSSRSELNQVLGWLYAELGTSHAKVDGGDIGPTPEVAYFGVLGADLEWAGGSFRVGKILEGAASDISHHRSPLSQPLDGDPVVKGEYLLEIDGKKVTREQTLWPELEKPKPLRLKIGNSASDTQCRWVTIVALDCRAEQDLRLRDWIEKNRHFVDRVSGGLVGYAAIPSTTGAGHALFTRQFQAQYHKPGLIYDGRFIPGGVYPEPIIDLISRPRTALFRSRSTEVGRESRLSRVGAQVLLINRWAGSGGDLLPYLFRHARLGKVIGTRTWGGTVASKGSPLLLDGGRVVIPSMAFIDPSGARTPENRGVEPDFGFECEEGLGKLAAGIDEQLEAGIARVLWELLAPRFKAKSEEQKRPNTIQADRIAILRQVYQDNSNEEARETAKALDRCLKAAQDNRSAEQESEKAGRLLNQLIQEHIADAIEQIRQGSSPAQTNPQSQSSASTQGNDATSGLRTFAASTASPNSPRNKPWR